MTTELLLKYALLLNVSISLTAVFVLVSRRGLRDFPAFCGFLTLNVVNQTIALLTLFYRNALHIPRTISYLLYYWANLTTDVLSLFLMVLIIYAVFEEAMRPFPGLQRAGQIVFRWVGVASFAVAVALAIGPQAFARQTTAAILFQELTSRLSQGINVLILCLLIFVCFAIRPLGLTFRSRVFGVTLGLAIVSMVDLVQCAWTAIAGRNSLYSPVYVFSVLGSCVALSVWLTYFAMPQPKRRMILLPTTSPFFFWNRISEILGDAPGNVAVAGFTPDMLSAAEVEMLTAATAQDVAEDSTRDSEAAAWSSFDSKTTVALPSFAKAPRASLALSQ